MSQLWLNPHTGDRHCRLPESRVKHAGTAFIRHSGIQLLPRCHLAPHTSPRPLDHTQLPRPPHHYESPSFPMRFNSMSAIGMMTMACHTQIVHALPLLAGRWSLLWMVSATGRLLHLNLSMHGHRSQASRDSKALWLCGSGQPNRFKGSKNPAACQQLTPGTSRLHQPSWRTNENATEQWQ